MKDTLNELNRYFSEGIQNVVESITALNEGTVKDAIIRAVDIDRNLSKGYLLEKADNIVFSYIYSRYFKERSKEISFETIKEVEDFVYSLPEECEKMNISEIKRFANDIK